MRSTIYETTAHPSLTAAAFAVSIIAGVLAATLPALAEGSHPYCAAGDNDVRCDFSTFRQCEATGFNTGQSCLMNPGPIYIRSTMGSRGVDNSQASANSGAIRQHCIATAQARYPDSGLGTVTVMTQRTGVYADCARANGINP